jgi:hypothetical protein
MAIIVPKGTGPQAEKRPEEDKAKAGKGSDIIDIEEEYPISFTEAAPLPAAHFSCQLFDRVFIPLAISGRWHATDSTELNYLD